MKNIHKKSWFFQKAIALLVFSLLCSTAVNAQDPNWSVNENDFEYNMTFIAFLSIDGERLASPNDKVGLFVNNVCRGTAPLTYVAATDSYFTFPAAFANVAGEVMEIRIYNSTTDEVRVTDATVTFQINAQQGTLFQAISWADPALSNEADLLDFNFLNVNPIDQSIDGTNYTLFLEDTIDITSLTPVYTLSANAEMFINTAAQTSGNDVVDFSQPVVYQVRSHDQSVVNEYTVTIVPLNNDIVYRKREAICYQDGAIKVSSTLEGTSVTLLTEGSQIAQATITNGEVLFEDLEAATYAVQIGNITKEIIINLETN